MAIKDFNPNEFAQGIAQQAMQVIPADISKEQGDYIINKVYQFAMLAGDALNQDPNVDLNLSQAQLITQYIAEWTYHKSIDIIRSSIPQDYWDQILQQIAFAIFQKAKELRAEGNDLSNVNDAIETIVSHSYQFAIKELANNGILAEDAIPEILSHSNLKDMAQKTYEPDETVSQEQREINLKYASVALLLKSMEQKHRDKILSNLDGKEEIESYMQDKDLAGKVKAEDVKECLDEIKKSVIKKKKEEPKVNYITLIKELKEKYSEQEIYNLVKFERKKISNFVSFAIEDEPSKDLLVKMSPYMARAIYAYLRAKLNTETQNT